jgi:UDP-N-acetylmuramoyl-tripeptide--D-alanyl-D-alanine ligase
MRPTTVGAIATAVGGAVREGADTAIASVATDSRAVRPDGIFVALVGDRLDGHDYVEDALERGAAAVLVRSGSPVDAPAVYVRDTGDALLELGAAERRGFDGSVIAITGANGKTSTKDLAGAVTGTRYRTHVSPLSFNNEVGVPMTLLGAPPDTEVIVAELGARHVGDVTRLCAVASPQMAVVTNVGVAHLEVFGSWEAIVEASAEPVDALASDGVAILSADDPVVAGYAARTQARVVTFGRGTDADVRADDITLDRDGTASFELRHDDERARVRLRVPGEHMVANALAAADIGHGGGRARAERRLQREPRVRRCGAEDGQVDGGRRTSDRRPRTDGRARPDHDDRARTGRRARRAAAGRSPARDRTGCRSDRRRRCPRRCGARRRRCVRRPRRGPRRRRRARPAR